ncbi:DUF6612 family protein [Paenibacillus sp. 1P07SE]|uniref:DUF6612 family protein n=1 Tax=Paenibacillus sp. 1P07SE TaxID=3132209 RepID=UPI0039A5FD21
MTTSKDGEPERTEKNRITSQTIFTREPAAIHQVNENENLISGALWENVVYITAEGTFMNGSGEWVKHMDGMRDHMLLSMESQSGPLVQLHRFRDNAQEMEVREEEEHYALTLDLEGDEVKGRNDLLLSDPEYGVIHTGGGRPDRMKITYEVRKTDHLPVRIEMDSSYTVSGDEGTYLFDVVESLLITYDPVEPIVIPEEALDTTQEVTGAPLDAIH